MVRRLIQDEEVCVGEYQLGERDASALTAAQITDALEHILPGEEESRQYIADLGIVQVRIIVRDLFEQCLLAVEHMMLLIVIADLYIGT